MRHTLKWMEKHLSSVHKYYVKCFFMNRAFHLSSSAEWVKGNIHSCVLKRQTEY